MLQFFCVKVCPVTILIEIIWNIRHTHIKRLTIPGIEGNRKINFTLDDEISSLTEICKLGVNIFS